MAFSCSCFLLNQIKLYFSIFKEPISYDDSFESDSSEDDNLPIKIPQKVNIEDEFTNEKVCL